MNYATLKVPLTDDSTVCVGFVQTILDYEAIGVGLVMIGFLA